MRRLLDAIRSTGKSQGPRLVALYGCMYYGMLRPSEAVSLLAGECELPAEGWGLLEFREVRSAAGREWTDDGGCTRRVSRRAARGTRCAGSRSRPSWSGCCASTSSRTGLARMAACSGPTAAASTRRPLWQVLQKARVTAFPPAVVASPLARKPYDFRHAGVSWRLNAGVPGPQVA